MKTLQVVAMVVGLATPGLALANHPAVEGSSGSHVQPAPETQRLDVKTAVRAWAPMVGAVGMMGVGALGSVVALGMAGALAVWQVGNLAGVDEPITAGFPGYFTRGPMQLIVLALAGGLDEQVTIQLATVTSFTMVARA